MQEITLFDIPSKGRCACWSFNPGKGNQADSPLQFQSTNSRCSSSIFLNFKGIPYQTEWLEYSDIAPTFQSLGIPPNEKGTPYTIPAIRFGDEYVMDSANIAAKLEKRRPSPPLHIDSSLVSQVQKILDQIIGLLRGVLLTKVPRILLHQASVSLFTERCHQMFGMPLEQLEAEMGGDDAWEAANPVLKELGNLLKAEDGSFLLGKIVSYADLVIIATLRCIKRIDEDFYGQVVDVEPVLENLFEASKEWLERDDH